MNTTKTRRPPPADSPPWHVAPRQVRQSLPIWQVRVLAIARLTAARAAATMAAAGAGRTRGEATMGRRVGRTAALLAMALWAAAGGGGCGGAKADGDDAAASTADSADDAAPGDGATDAAAAGDGATDAVAVEGGATDGGAIDSGAPPQDVIDVPDGPCTPSCKGKICGPDGCGSVCGFCATGAFCGKDGTACEEFCKPKCEGKSCGDNGCGGDCGACGEGKVCGVDSLCHLEDCVGACDGKVCGDDGCGKLCGTCASGDVCSSAGKCKPSPCKGIPAEGACDGQILLGCSGEGVAAQKTTVDCGAQLPVGSQICAWDPLSAKHACVAKPPCAPSCKKPDGTAKECGDDGCGGICKTCLEGWACEGNTCMVKAGGVCGGTFNQKTGACQGNTWLLCSAGKIVAVDCGSAAKTCTWTGSAYGCK